MNCDCCRVMSPCPAPSPVGNFDIDTTMNTQHKPHYRTSVNGEGFAIKPFSLKCGEYAPSPNLAFTVSMYKLSNTIFLSLMLGGALPLHVVPLLSIKLPHRSHAPMEIRSTVSTLSTVRSHITQPPHHTHTIPESKYDDLSGDQYTNLMRV